MSVTTKVLDSLNVGLIGQSVEVGIYQKSDDALIGVDAGVLTGYTVTANRAVIGFEQRHDEKSGTAWNPETQYILITVLVENTEG